MRAPWPRLALALLLGGLCVLIFGWTTVQRRPSPPPPETLPVAPLLRIWPTPAATPLATCLNAACVLHDAEFSTGGSSLRLLTSDAAAAGQQLALNNDPGSRIFDVLHRRGGGGGGGGGGGVAGVSASVDGRRHLFIVKEPYNIDSMHNMGHLLADDVFASFHILHEFGLHELPRSDVWFVLQARFRREVAEKRVIRDHFSLLSSNPILFFDDDDSFAAVGGGPARFERLLFGWAQYGYSRQDRGQRPISEAVVRAFRHRTLQVFNLEEDGPPQASLPACSVLFIEKDVLTARHVYSVGNLDELLNALRERTACTVERVKWAGMPLQSQVAAIYKKRIVVSLMGADLINCIFQPLRSGIIVPDQCIPETSICPSSREVELWYSRLPSRLVTTIPAKGGAIEWRENVATWSVDQFVADVVAMHRTLGEVGAEARSAAAAVAAS